MKIQVIFILFSLPLLIGWLLIIFFNDQVVFNQKKKLVLLWIKKNCFYDNEMKFSFSHPLFLFLVEKTVIFLPSLC